MSDIALTLHRFSEDQRATLGVLSYAGGPVLCDTLENVWADNKPRVSCIPPGVYRLRVRMEGGWHERLKARFPAIHKGSIELADVPGRTFILIHPGNTHADTLGCILPGVRVQWPDGPDRSMNAVGSSASTYQRIYPALLEIAEAGLSMQVLDLSHRSRAGTVT